MPTVPGEYDIAIIGGGIIGCAVSYELIHRLTWRILLLESRDDLGGGASRANSGILHGAYAADHHSIKGRLLARGNRLWSVIAPRLSIPRRETGALVLAFDDGQLASLDALRENGAANGFEPEILSGEETRRRQDGLSPQVRGALYAADVGVISPYEAAIALGQEAGRSGLEIRLNTPVTAVVPLAGGGYELTSGRETFRARILINAAGAGAAAVAAMLGDEPFVPRLRRGQYILFRRGSADFLNHVLFQVPGPMGKGILVAPTAWGNLMIGPNAETVDDPADTATTVDGLEEILRKARLSIPDLPLKKMMRDFSGIRPGIEGGDFHIDWSTNHPGVLHMGGIDSPGLTAAPAIAEMVAGMIAEGIGSSRDPAGYRRHPWHTGPAELGPMKPVLEDADRSPGDPMRIICRCEQVREGTLAAAYEDAGAAGIRLNSTDAVKRRTRAGMGACQGQFCRPRVAQWLRDHNGPDAPEPQFGRVPSQAFREVYRRATEEPT
jgi:glycerol-3-phosphate dehydrogenase